MKQKDPVQLNKYETRSIFYSIFPNQYDNLFDYSLVL